MVKASGSRDRCDSNSNPSFTHWWLSHHSPCPSLDFPICKMTIPTSKCHWEDQVSLIYNFVPSHTQSVSIVCTWSLSCVWLFVTRGLYHTRPSVHGIFQARLLEWVAIAFSRESSQPKVWICISCIAGGFLTTEPPAKHPPLIHYMYVNNCHTD